MAEHQAHCVLAKSLRFIRVLDIKKTTYNNMLANFPYQAHNTYYGTKKCT